METAEVQEIFDFSTLNDNLTKLPLHYQRVPRSFHIGSLVLPQISQAVLKQLKHAQT